MYFWCSNMIRYIRSCDVWHPSEFVLFLPNKTNCFGSCNCVSGNLNDMSTLSISDTPMIITVTVTRGFYNKRNCNSVTCWKRVSYSSNADIQFKSELHKFLFGMPCLENTANALYWIALLLFVVNNVFPFYIYFYLLKSMCFYLPALKLTKIIQLIEKNNSSVNR